LHYFQTVAMPDVTLGQRGNPKVGET
jgi:hypothetical protein